MSDIKNTQNPSAYKVTGTRADNKSNHPDHAAVLSLIPQTERQLRSYVKIIVKLVLQSIIKPKSKIHLQILIFQMSILFIFFPTQ